MADTVWIRAIRQALTADQWLYHRGCEGKYQKELACIANGKL